MRQHGDSLCCLRLCKYITVTQCMPCARVLSQPHLIPEWHEAFYNRGAWSARIVLLQGVSCSTILNPYYPSKHKTFVLHLCNVGPTSKTLGRRCTNVIQMFCVCWDRNLPCKAKRQYMLTSLVRYCLLALQGSTVWYSRQVLSQKTWHIYQCCFNDGLASLKQHWLNGWSLLRYPIHFPFLS